jgi:hypothetical protein
MTPLLRAIAVTLLAGMMTAACSKDLPDEPGAGGPQADVSIAQVPANDDFANAVVINSLRFTDNLNTSEATSAATDPGDCDIGGHTVWYQFTPSENMRLNANTFGSDYDTGIGVYTSSAGSLTLVACNDDAVVGQFVQSNLNFDAVAGQTYFFMVGSFGDSPGGNLVFNVDVSVDLTLTIKPIGAVDAKSGQATISGTITCSEPVSGTLDGQVQQRIGRTLVTGGFFTFFECDGVTPWEVQVSSGNGLFVGGRVQVVASAFAFDRDFTQAVATVRLQGKGK